jgi:hypothetical protein
MENKEMMMMVMTELDGTGWKKTEKEVRIQPLCR